MRIMLTATYGWPEVYRGGERYLHELADFLQQAGHDVRIVVSGPGAARDVVRGVPVYRLRPREFRRFGELGREVAFGAAALAAIGWRQLDVWHATSTADAAAAAQLGRLRDLRTVFTDHGFPLAASRERRSDYRLYRMVLRHIDSYVCVSRRRRRLPGERLPSQRRRRAPGSRHRPLHALAPLRGAHARVRGKPHRIAKRPAAAGFCRVPAARVDPRAAPGGVRAGRAAARDRRRGRRLRGPRSGPSRRALRGRLGDGAAQHGRAVRDGAHRIAGLRHARRRAARRQRTARHRPAGSRACSAARVSTRSPPPAARPSTSPALPPPPPPCRERAMAFDWRTAIVPQLEEVSSRVFEASDGHPDPASPRPVTSPPRHRLRRRQGPPRHDARLPRRARGPGRASTTTSSSSTTARPTARTRCCSNAPRRFRCRSRCNACRARSAAPGRPPSTAVTAPLMAFTDSDCIPEPAIGWQGSAPRSREGVDVVQGRTDPGARPCTGAGRRRCASSSGADLYETCNIAYRTEALREAGGFDSTPPI